MSPEASQSQTGDTRGQAEVKRRSPYDNIGQTEVNGGHLRSKEATIIGQQKSNGSPQRPQKPNKDHQRPTAVKQRFPAALRGQTEVTGVNRGKKRLPDADRDKTDVQRHQMSKKCPLRPTEIKQTCPEVSRGQTEITRRHQKLRTKVKKRFPEAYGSKLIFKMPTKV